MFFASEHEVFEIWQAEVCNRAPLDLVHDGRRYLDPEVEVAWTGWQARAKHTPMATLLLVFRYLQRNHRI